MHRWEREGLELKNALIFYLVGPPISDWRHPVISMRSRGARRVLGDLVVEWVV